MQPTFGTFIACESMRRLFSSVLPTTLHNDLTVHCFPFIKLPQV